jgi:hypothetical protein
MKTVTAFCFCLLAFNVVSAFAIESDSLFQIHVKGKTGFINQHGKVVIQPIFSSVGEFSEGLCPARTGGLYGYINTSGKFMIEPRFDYATSFSEGLAVVFVGRKPFYINAQGTNTIALDAQTIGSFARGLAFITTHTGKTGVINKKGALVIDTAYSKIETFVDGRAIVYGQTHKPEDEIYYDQINEVGIIDEAGNFIVSYGEYTEIEIQEDGIYRVKTNTSHIGYIDKNGNTLLATSESEHGFQEGEFHDGLAIMTVMDEAQISGMSAYKVVMNTKGEVVIDSPYYDMIFNFYDNRAFAVGLEDNYSLIDTRGNIIASQRYRSFGRPGFRNGLAFVYTADGWGIIDTMANYILKPSFAEITSDLMGDQFFFSDKKPGTSVDDNSYGYGLADVNGNIIIPSIADDFDKSGFVNGLLKATVDGKLTYFNKEGKIVWQEQLSKKSAPITMDLDYMNRGYFYANSISDKTSSNTTHYRKSENYPNKIGSQSAFPPETLSISTKFVKDKIFENQYTAITVFLSNNTGHEFYFHAKDCRLYMKMQARDKDGIWKDIEYIPMSGGQNSNHIVTLDPFHYWSFLAPVYSGDFKTKLRIAVEYIVGSAAIDSTEMTDENGNKLPVATVWSPEFKGSVNPGQFWRKRKYQPDGSVHFPYDFHD